jgi:hypothetical protein
MKTCDWLSGTKLPLSVSVFELKFGLTVAEALLLPSVSVMNTCAEMAAP